MIKKKIEGMQTATFGHAPGTLWGNRGKKTPEKTDSHTVNVNTDNYQSLERRIISFQVQPT